MEENQIQRFQKTRPKKKLSALHITKFNGSNINCVRLWYQFEKKLGKCKHYVSNQQVHLLAQFTNKSTKESDLQSVNPNLGD